MPKSSNYIPQFLDLPPRKRRSIVKRNRGFTQEVADMLGVNRSNIHRILYGRATSARIARAIDMKLRALGELPHAPTVNGVAR
jgi:hypothetical protein